MGYYMRYFTVSDQGIDVELLGSELKKRDLKYAFINVTGDKRGGDLTFKCEMYAQVEINRPGDGLFDDEIEEFKELANGAEGHNREKVLHVLGNAKCAVSVQVLHGSRESEETLQRIDPIWEWLFANRPGLMHADGEGFYDKSGLILEVS